MKATVLIGELGVPSLNGQWGFSLYLEYQGHHILLDAGSSELLRRRAAEYGLDLSRPEFAVLSHAHFDHADGMPYFFEDNATAPLYLRAEGREAYYECPQGKYNYIGISPVVYQKYAHRLIEVTEKQRQIIPGVWLLAHSSEGRAEIGARCKLYRKQGEAMLPDDFRHEQSLIFEEDDGLVVFNSCSHGGIFNILTDVRAAFLGRAIKALVGGFHLVGRPEDEVRALGRELNELALQKVCTGHCTGEQPCVILEQELGERLTRLENGMVLEF